MKVKSESEVAQFLAGDVRIGGTYTSEYVRVANNTWQSTSDRATRLTVMPGGSLKVLSQSGDFNGRGAGAFAVAAGGTVDIAGTELLLTSNNTHYVDGAMTVTCPLVAQGGRQVFRGDGTLTLSGGLSGDGSVRVEGGLTLVPGGEWRGDVALSFKDDVTVAPTADWAFRGASLDLAHHSKLTIATGGHTVTLGRPIASDSGTLAVTGNGTVEIAAEGMSLDKVEMADGATFTVAKDVLASGSYVDVLAVREDDDSISFSSANRKLRKRVDENGYTVYSVKGKKGIMLIFR